MTTNAITHEEVIEAATSVARDVAEGTISPAELERQAVQELTALMLLPADEGTELYGLRIEVTRRVLAEGGVPADELSEWAAVQRRRENPDAEPIPEAVATLDGSEPDQGDEVPSVDLSSVSDDLSAEFEVTEEIDVDPVEEPDAGYVHPQRGPKGGVVVARGFGTPIDNGLRRL